MHTELVLPGTPASLWPHLTQPASLTRWCTRLLGLDLPLDSPAGTPLAFRCLGPGGLAYDFPGQVLAVEPNRLVKWTGMTERFHTTGLYTLRPHGDDTLLRHTVRVQPRYRLAARLADMADAAVGAAHRNDLMRLRGQLQTRFAVLLRPA